MGLTREVENCTCQIDCCYEWLPCQAQRFNEGLLFAGNLLKCPHCAFMCGSDQKGKYEAHVSAHTAQEKSQPAKKIPELVAMGPKKAGPARQERTLLPRPPALKSMVSLPTARTSAEPKGAKSKSLLRTPDASPPKKRAKGPVQVAATPVVTQIPGSAIMLRIQVDGQPGVEQSGPAPSALVPVTLYQCARCRLNFNTKEAVEKHLCVIPPNLIPVALKPGETIPIALKPGETIPIALKPGEPRPIAVKPGEPIPIAPKPTELVAITPKPGEPIPIAPKPGDVEFTCNTCGIHFADAALLREHVLTHYQTYKCDHCESAFRSEFHLKQHLKKHASEKREYPCPQCPKVYTVKSVPLSLFSPRENDWIRLYREC